MKKVILFIILILSFLSCIKEDELEYHEMIFQYVILPEKIVVLYDTNLEKTVFIPHGNDTFGIDILFLAQLHGHPIMTMIYNVNTKQYYKT